MIDLKTKLAQIFPVYGSFIPAKASVGLKTSLYANSDYFIFGNQLVIDSTNFSAITGSSNSVIFNDSVVANTGKGTILFSQQDASSSIYPILHYPINFDTINTYDVYIRVYKLGNVTIKLFLNNTEIDSSVVPLAGWGWHNVSLNISSIGLHSIGISSDNNAYIDKIIIQDTAEAAPVGLGYNYSVSPYVTLHCLLYSVANDLPQDQYNVYSYKTSIGEIKQDGIYNFDISPIDNTVISYTDLCALVLVSTGSYYLNYISWDLLDSNEYALEPSLYYNS